MNDSDKTAGAAAPDPNVKTSSVDDGWSLGPGGAWLSAEDGIQPPISRDVLGLFQELHRARTMLAFSPDDTSPAVPVLLTPKGIEAHSMKRFLDEYAHKPDRRVGTAKASTEASFVAHVQRFRSPDTAIFARRSRTAPQLQAVYDYHPATSDVRAAAFGHHRCEYDCPLSPEWLAWEAIDGKPMDVATFAAFLEDRITDVATFAAFLEDRITDVAHPILDAGLAQFAELVGGTWAEPADLIALSRGLQVNVDVQVRQAVTLNTGEIRMTFSEQHKDGQGEPMRIANLFLIQIPVFEAGAPYRIPVRLRYQVREGKIVWRCQRYRADRVFTDAIEEMATRVADATTCPLFFGALES